LVSKTNLQMSSCFGQYWAQKIKLQMFEAKLLKFID
jgi:hypothetical protein